MAEHWSPKPVVEGSIPSLYASKRYILYVIDGETPRTGNISRGRLSGKPHLSNAHHMVYFGSMVELVDTIVSRAIVERRIGSSPI